MSCRKLKYYTHKKSNKKSPDCLPLSIELITAEFPKLRTYKAPIKKGLMQKLFPAEGKPCRNCGFPSFGIKGSGKGKTIDNFMHHFQWWNPWIPQTSNLYNGNISFIRSAEIDKANHRVTSSNEGFINFIR